MTSASNYSYVPANAPQTHGLTSSQYSKLPSPAIVPGGSMPPAWQSRNGPYYDGQRPDVPVRSLLDIASDPLRVLTATKPRKIVSGLSVVALALTVLF